MSGSGDDFEYLEVSSTSSQEDFMVVKVEKEGKQEEKVEMKQEKKEEEKKKEEKKEEEKKKAESVEAGKDLMERIMKEALQEVHAPSRYSYLEGTGCSTDISRLLGGFEPISKLLPDHKTRGQGCSVSKLITPREIKHGITLDRSIDRLIDLSPVTQGGSKADRLSVPHDTAGAQASEHHPSGNPRPNPFSKLGNFWKPGSKELPYYGIKEVLMAPISDRRDRNSSRRDKMAIRQEEKMAEELKKLKLHEDGERAEQDVDGSKVSASSSETIPATEKKAATGISGTVLTQKKIKVKKVASNVIPQYQNDDGVPTRHVYPNLPNHTGPLNQVPVRSFGVPITQFQNENHPVEYRGQQPVSYSTYHYAGQNHQNGFISPLADNNNYQQIPRAFPASYGTRNGPIACFSYNINPAPIPHSLPFTQETQSGCIAGCPNNSTYQTSHPQPFSVPQVLQNDFISPIPSNIFPQPMQQSFSQPQYQPVQPIHVPVPMISNLYANCPQYNPSLPISGLSNSCYDQTPFNSTPQPVHQFIIPPSREIPKTIITKDTPKWEGVKRILHYIESAMDLGLLVYLSDMKYAATIDLEEFIRQNMSTFIELSPMNVGGKATFKVTPI